MLDYRTGVLVNKVFRHFCDERGANRLGECFAQQAEKGRPTHHDQAREFAALVRPLEFGRNAPGEDFCFMPSRGTLPTSRVVRGGAAAPCHEWCMVELSSRSVGPELSIVQVGRRVA